MGELPSVPMASGSSEESSASSAAIRARSNAFSADLCSSARCASHEGSMGVSTCSMSMLSALSATPAPARCARAPRSFHAHTHTVRFTFYSLTFPTRQDAHEFGYATILLYILQDERESNRRSHSRTHTHAPPSPRVV